MTPAPVYAEEIKAQPINLAAETHSRVIYHPTNLFKVHSKENYGFVSPEFLCCKSRQIEL